MSALPDTTFSTALGEVLARADAARLRLAGLLRCTPLDPSPVLSAAAGAEVLIKAEHLQYTGSFKVRGALARLSTLSDADREAGVVTASSGNHGLGVAYALSVLGGRGVVYVPTQASPTKLDAIRRYGVEVRLEGTDGLDAELAARAHAEGSGRPYISPYNDLDVIAGQAGIAYELLEQAGPRGLDAVVVAVGGGGLVSGVAAVLKRANPDLLVIGASPANDAAVAHSVAAGAIGTFAATPTLSDATAGGLEPGAVTYALCRGLVDSWVLVEEADIAAHLRLFLDAHHQLIEGAAAVALAATRQAAGQLEGRRLAVISCGANISLDSLRTALAAGATD